MSYKTGDIVLVKFPFSNLKKSKKRPVLIVKDENSLHDILCFQITSNADQLNLLKIEKSDLNSAVFSINSYIKYDKCFTLNTEIVDKKIATLTPELLEKLKSIFCNNIF